MGYMPVATTSPPSRMGLPEFERKKKRVISSNSEKLDGTTPPLQTGHDGLDWRFNTTPSTKTSYAQGH